MILGMYCNWRVKVDPTGVFYISALNMKYLIAFKKKCQQVILLTNISSQPISNDDQPIIDLSIEVIPLPEYKTYLQSFKFFSKIIAGMKILVSKSDFIYVKTPEPFSWYFSFFKSNKKINYHFVSNPLEVILKRKGFFKKTFTYLLFLPEYYLICIAARLTNCSANGPSVIKNTPFFLKKKIRILIENTLSEDDLDNKLFIPKKLNPPYVFICVSRLQNSKGLFELIDAFTRFNKNTQFESKLLIVGDGPLNNELSKFIDDNNAGGFISMLGHVENGEPLNLLYRKSDFLINPSLSETGPRVILEGMAEGVVCISTDVGYVSFIYNQVDCLPELIISQNADFNDEFGSIANRLLSNPLLYKNLSEKSVSLSKKYSLDKFVLGILDVENK